MHKLRLRTRRSAESNPRSSGAQSPSRGDESLKGRGGVKEKAKSGRSGSSNGIGNGKVDMMQVLDGVGSDSRLSPEKQPCLGADSDDFRTSLILVRGIFYMDRT